MPAGAASSRSLRFVANTATASFSARCRSRTRASTAAETISLTRHAKPHGGRQPRRRGGRRGSGRRRAPWRSWPGTASSFAAVEVEGEHLLLLAAHDGQHAVRRHASPAARRNRSSRGTSVPPRSSPPRPTTGDVRSEPSVQNLPAGRRRVRRPRPRARRGCAARRRAPRRRRRRRSPTNPAAASSGTSVGSASSRSASGSSPASRAICALVRRLGLYGR